MRKKLVLEIINALILLCIAVLMVCCYLALAKTKIGAWEYVADAVMVASFVFGALYFYNGFSKKASVMYKAFMYSSVVYFALNNIVILRANQKISALISIPAMAAFVISIIMAVGKDMGRRNTLILSFLLLVCMLIPLICGMVYYGEFGNAGPYFILGSVLRLALSLNAITMIFGKFNDKKLRGREVK